MQLLLYKEKVIFSFGRYFSKKILFIMQISSFFFQLVSSQNKLEHHYFAHHKSTPYLFFLSFA